MFCVSTRSVLTVLPQARHTCKNPRGFRAKFYYNTPRIIMTSKSATKPSSFSINDILDMTNDTNKDDFFDKRNHRLSADINNNDEKEDRLKSTPNVHESTSSVFRPCPRTSNPNSYRSEMLARCEDYRKRAESFYHKNAYHSEDKYSPLNRSSIAYSSGYGAYMGLGRLHLPSASPYLDPYGSHYSNGRCTYSINHVSFIHSN